MGSPTVKGALSLLSPTRPQLLRMQPKVLSQLPEMRGGLQTLEDLARQVQSRLGASPKAVDYAFGNTDRSIKATPQTASAILHPPQQYAQRGARSIRTGDMSGDDYFHEAAGDLLWSPQVAPQREQVFRQLLEEARVGGDADPADAMALLRAPEARTNYGQWETRAKNFLEDAHPNYEELEFEYLMEGVPGQQLSAYDAAMELARRSKGEWANSFTPRWGAYQRQPQATGGDYFETVLRGGVSRERSLTDHHFDNPSQLGHIRGNVAERPQGLSVMLEEIQSDPLEQIGNMPVMQGIYGRLGRMALDRSAEAGATELLIPDAMRIASVRDQSKLPFYQKVYDKSLGKELYSPMAERGMPVSYDNGFWRLGLTEQIRNAIKDKSGILDFKCGGLAQMRNASR